MSPGLAPVDRPRTSKDAARTRPVPSPGSGGWLLDPAAETHGRGACCAQGEGGRGAVQGARDGELRRWIGGRGCRCRGGRGGGQGAAAEGPGHLVEDARPWADRVRALTALGREVEAV